MIIILSGAAKYDIITEYTQYPEYILFKINN